MKIATKRGLIVAFAIVVLGFIIATIIMATAPKAKSRPHADKKVSVQTIQLKPQDIMALIETTGTAQTAKESAISAQVSGVVEYVNPALQPGAMIKRGEILFEIDKSDYEAYLKEAEASLQSAEADFASELGSQEVAKKELSLSGRKLSPVQKSLTLREPQLKIAQANIAKAEAAVQQAKSNLARTTIKAPYDSIVANTPLSLGAMATTGVTLVELVDNSNFWVLAEVDTHLLKYIDFGDKEGVGSKAILSALSDSDGIKYEGAVKSLLPKTNESSKRPVVLIEFKIASNQTQTIFDGDIVSVAIEGRVIDGVYKLPWDLLKNSKEVWLYKDGILKIKDIEIIHKNSSEIIVRGLTPKDEIITTSIGGARDGLKLKKALDAAK